MESESEIFIDKLDLPSSIGSAEPSLISRGRLFAYYRIAHEGRYFFFKTYAEDTPHVRRLLKREYELSASCENPYIARTFIFGEFIAGKEGILMEYIDGVSLQDFMASNPSPAIRRRLFGQLLDAVGYLHGKGIIHNDIKPENILVSRNGTSLRLIDFGLSDDDAHYLLKTPGCTDLYAAPEVRESRRSSVVSDIYSIGMIMRLLFGRRYGRFSRKCLREKPERRYQNVYRLSRAWQRRNLSYYIAGAFLLIALLSFSVYLYVHQNEVNTRRLHSVEGELQLQKDRNLSQGKELEGLKESYSEMSDAYEEVRGAYSEMETAYSDIKGAYDGMKDSLETRRNTIEAHERKVNEALGEFKKGLELRAQASFDSLSQDAFFKQRNRIRQNYDSAVRKYYAEYPKTADGEDITIQLNSLLQDNIEASRYRYNALLRDVFNKNQD